MSEILRSAVSDYMKWVTTSSTYSTPNRLVALMGIQYNSNDTTQCSMLKCNHIE